MDLARAGPSEPSPEGRLLRRLRRKNIYDPGRAFVIVRVPSRGALEDRRYGRWEKLAMCGRYTLTTDHRALAALPWPLAPGFEWRPRYNVAPTQWAPVVADLEGLCVASFRWGLIPHWARDAKIGNRMINARVEGVDRSTAYKGPLRRRRCLVLADGFFEWQKIGGKKTPIYIRRGDGGLLSFAGLWDRWVSAEGEEIRSFTILTGPPNELLRPIHDRMPVILSEALQEAWIRDPPEDTLPELRRPREVEGLEAYAVSRAVNSPANDAPELIEPVGDIASS